MAKLNMHPSPGFGDLLPGFFVVPQNPIAGQKPISYIHHIGDLLPGRFAVPQNPIISTVRAGTKAMAGLAGCCSGCSSGQDGTAFLNGAPLPGIGGIGDALGSINWLTVGVAVGAAWLLTQRKGAR